MAECYFKSITSGHDVEVFSAGIGAGYGWRATPEAKQVMDLYNLNMDNHISRPLDDSMVKRADMLVVMTDMHRDRILFHWPDAANKIYLLREFDKNAAGEDLNVFDPVGCSFEIYEKCFDLMKNALQHLGDLLCKK